MERHPEVAYKHVQRLDEQRAQSTADPDVLRRFYQLIAHQVHLYRIHLAQLFNCDEKGIIMGRTARTKGIVSAGGLRRRHYARGNSNRESATALETISAAGAVLPPFYVLNGVRYSAGWYADHELSEEEATYAVQANATMDVELGMAYMSDHFDKYTVAVIGGVGRGYRMLIVDGHKSHISWQAV